MLGVPADADRRDAQLLRARRPLAARDADARARSASGSASRCRADRARAADDPRDRGRDRRRRADRRVVPRADAGDRAAGDVVQRRMYVIQQGNPRSTSYNLPLLYEVDGERRRGRDRARVRAARRAPRVAAHGVLLPGGRDPPEDRAAPKFELERFELDDRRPRRGDGDVRAAVPARGAAAVPRRRARRTRGRVAYLALDMHHIVSRRHVDRRARSTICSRSCSSARCPTVALRYFDYSAWLASDAGARAPRRRASTYWAGAAARRAARARPALRLPPPAVARSRPPARSRSSCPQATVDAIARSRASARRRRSRSTQPLYARVPVVPDRQRATSCSASRRAGRPHPDFERVVGMFVNSLPFRARIDADDTFDDARRAAR